MSDVPTLDGQARAELLCYLVVKQLLAHVHRGRWLRPDHSVESIRIWLIARREYCSVFEGIGFGQLLEKVAKRTCHLDYFLCANAKGCRLLQAIALG